MNLFILADGRRTFYQWDTNRQLIVIEPICAEVHFDNGTKDFSLVREVKIDKGLRVVDVPDILLQSTKSINVFAYVCDGEGGYTRRSVVFPVMARPKPADYPFAGEDEQRLDDLERTAVKSVNSIGPDENGNVDVDGMPADLDCMKMLIDEDMLPTIHTQDGAILTDKIGTVILRL